jgi:hypothetical protein
MRWISDSVVFWVLCIGIFFTPPAVAQTSLSDEDAAGYKALTVHVSVFVAA